MYGQKKKKMLRRIFEPNRKETNSRLEHMTLTVCTVDRTLLR